MIDSFINIGVDVVIINVVGCGYIFKEYGNIFQDDFEYCEKVKEFFNKVKDVQEFLVNVGLIIKFFFLVESEELIIVY